MESATSLSRDDHLVEARNRRLALRVSTSDYRPTAKRDTVLLGTTSFRGDSVYDVAGRFLGKIEEVIVDIHFGRVAYVLMAVGGFLGMGRKLFAIPWSMVTVDRVYQRCVLNMGVEQLFDAPSPDGDLLPRMADPSWAMKVHAYFGCKPYWE